MKLRVMTFLTLGVLLAPTVAGCNGGSNQVPEGAYCDPVSDWSSDMQAWESRMLELFNLARAAGANCGVNGDFGPTGPLTMEPALRQPGALHGHARPRLLCPHQPRWGGPRGPIRAGGLVGQRLG